MTVKQGTVVRRERKVQYVVQEFTGDPAKIDGAHWDKWTDVTTLAQELVYRDGERCLANLRKAWDRDIFRLVSKETDVVYKMEIDTDEEARS